MDTKKIAATFAILIIALGIAGFAYSMWSDTLVLNGTIKTGNVDVEWSFNGALTNGVKGNGYVVATMTGGIVGDTLTVTINNTFPGLSGWLEIDVHNKGSIPVKLYNCTGPTIGGTDLTPWINYTETWSGDGHWTQIDPCQNITLHIEFTFLQEAANEAIMPQGATMTIGYTLVFCNWNEQ
jgi:hypothetical protein